METLYERIKRLCEQKGIKPGKMCHDIGVSRSTVTDLKAGRKRGVNAKTANDIANYFGVSVDYLLTGSTSGIQNEIKRIPTCDMSVRTTKEGHIHVLKGLISYHERMTMGTYPERDFYLDTLRYALKAVEEKIERDKQ